MTTDRAGADEAGMLRCARLLPWLEAEVAGFVGPVRLTKFPGGQSNPTYRLEAASGVYVLRRKPFGDILPSAHAVDREHRLMSALHPLGFPVPRPCALCLDESVIGSVFTIMEFAEGRAHWDGTMPERTRRERSAVYRSMITTLADLHRIDPVEAGLGDYGRPGNYFGRQVARWTTQYRAAQTDDIPEAERLIAWLPATVPEQTRSSIIHGDYRIDNILFDPSGGVRAVLDWELSTLGDPLADFAYLAMNWAMPSGERGAGLLGVDFARTGIPTLGEATELYCARTDRDGVPDLDWYFAFNLFRLLGIVQGIKKRALDGNASSARALEAGSRVPMLAAQAWSFAERAGARA